MMHRTDRVRPASIMQALAWALGTVVVLVGVPVALGRLVGNPLPTVVPSREDLGLALTRGQVDAWTWVKAASLVAWVAWADLLAGFVVEVVATARGRSVGRRRGLATTRRLAAKVIGKWALLASLAVHAGSGPASVAPPVTAAMAAPVPVRVASAAVPAPAQPQVGRTVAARVPGAGAEGPGPEVEVERRDTLWRLAEAHLGDGGRWTVIREANVGRVMPDGTVLGSDFTRLQPGWRLVLPGPGAGPGDGPAVGGEVPDEVVVERGDSLWKLSRHHLQLVDHEGPGPVDAPSGPTNGAVARYVDAMVEANQPAIHDPDLIHPGEVLRLPDPGHRSQAPTAAAAPAPADQAPSPPAAPAPTQVPAPSPAGIDHAPAGPAVSVPASPAPSAGPAVSVPASPTTSAGPATSAGPTLGDPAVRPLQLAPDSTGPTLPAGSARGPEGSSGAGRPATDGLAGLRGDVPVAPDASGKVLADHQLGLGVAGGLLAAGALELVRRRRRYRLAHRRPSTVPAGPGRHLEDLERSLNGVGDAGTARWLAAALASLATRPVWAGEPIAQPVLARLEPDRLDVVFSQADPMAAPLPWTTLDGGLTWSLARATPTGDLPVAEARQAPPTLVTVGAGVLLSLEAVGCLGVSGAGSGPQDLARSLVHELATRAGAGPVDVRTTFPVEGTGSYPLVHRARPEDLVAELVPWLDAARSRLRGAGVANAYGYRLLDDQEPLVPVVVVADGASWAGLTPLHALATSGGLPFALVGVGLDVAAEIEGAHQIELAGGRASVRPLGITVEAQALSAGTARQLGELLADAASPVEEPLLPGLRLSASVTELRHRSRPASDPSADLQPRPARAERSRPPDQTADPAAAPPRPTGPHSEPVPADAVPVEAVPAEAAPSAMATAEPVLIEPALARRGDGGAGVTGPQGAGPVEEQATAAEPEASARLELGPAGELEAGQPEGDRPEGAGDGGLEAEAGVVAEEPLVVRVLGPVEIDGLEADLTSQQLSLLCYLACNGPSTRASLIDALWDGQVISQSRFPNLLTEVRARIGRHHFPESRDGRYELVGVTTDLNHLERAVALAGRQDTTSACGTLRTALEAVRGIPLAVPSPRFWSWVGDQTHFSARVEALVADTAAWLARLEQERNHLDGARWACEQGLLASPTDETLVTILTEVYMRSGKPGLARRLVEGWEERISRMDCGEPSDEPRKRLAG